MKTTTVSLDVRDDIRHGRDPFDRIMETVAQLGPDQDLCVVAPFEPIPLQAILGHQGFSHQGQPTPTGDWQVTFHRQASPPSPASKITNEGESTKKTQPTQPVMVDARNLEPPQPLVIILESLMDLAPGQTLIAHTDRRPIHLYEQLEIRGFNGVSHQLPDQSYQTHISRR